MGAHSTLELSRGAALLLYMRLTHSPSDEFLERMLDTLLDDKLHNVRIVGDDKGRDDDYAASIHP